MQIRTVFFALSSIALMGTASVNAEQYQGVQAPPSQLSRSEVRAGAVAAAREGDIYAEAAYAGVHSIATSTDRARVQREARAVANAANQNLDAKAFFNSVVPLQYRQRIVNPDEQATM